MKTPVILFNYQCRPVKLKECNGIREEWRGNLEQPPELEICKVSLVTDVSGTIFAVLHS